MATIPPLVSGYGISQHRTTTGAVGGSGHGPAAPDAPETIADPLRTALDSALKSAAGRQNGLAPLYADLAALTADADLHRPSAPPWTFFSRCGCLRTVLMGPACKRPSSAPGCFSKHPWREGPMTAPT